MTDRIAIHHGDSREVLKGIPDCSVDSCVTDPPYALVSIVKRFGSPDAAEVKQGSVYARASAGFMGQAWDTGETAFDPAFWAEVLRVLKPGGHVVAFGGSRSYGRLQVAIEDAGFEVRDGLINLISDDEPVIAFMQSLDDEQLRTFVRCIEDSQFGGLLAWIYGSGFPKSHDTERAIALNTCLLPGRHFARSVPAEGQLPGDHVCPATPQSEPWDGFGTALKPAIEPIILARKPLTGTVAENVLRWGTGALNIDACRIATEEELRAGAGGLLSHVRDGKPYPRGRDGEASAGKRYGDQGSTSFTLTPGPRGGDERGRWPANLIHDGSAEVLAAFPDAPGQQRAVIGTEPSARALGIYGNLGSTRQPRQPRQDEGSAARFFFSAKADAEDRLGSKHPTVKRVDLIRWLLEMVTPPGGVTIDPFAGTGTTGVAALGLGMRAILIERAAKSVEDIRRRIAWARGEGELTGQAIARRKPQNADPGPVFGGAKA